jgi:hypothetical protein
MRNSTAQVLNDAPLSKAPGTDGIFHPSCLQHGVQLPVQLQGQAWLAVLGDWFWGTGQLKQFYRMVEPPAGTGLPNNPYRTCKLPPAPAPGPGPGPGPAPSGGCATELRKDGCLNATTTMAGSDALNKCEKCAKAHKADLEAAGCTVAEARKLCGDSQ